MRALSGTVCTTASDVTLFLSALSQQADGCGFLSLDGSETNHQASSSILLRRTGDTLEALQADPWV